MLLRLRRRTRHRSDVNTPRPPSAVARTASV